MNFIVKTMGGEKITITEQEYKLLLNASGLVAFPSNGITINTSRIEAVYPEEAADKIEKKRDQQMGVLHDGTLVRRHFGVWVDAGNQVADDKGNYTPVRIDSEYYPEVARDCVPTQEEFESKYRALPITERKTLMLEGTSEKRLAKSSLESIGKIMTDV